MAVSSYGRAPRARLDPIFTAHDAMAVFRLAMSRPLRHETLVMFLDANDCGSSLVTVTGTDEAFHIVEIAETMALSACDAPDISGLVLATVRPGGCPLPGDDELWLEAADLVADCGLILVDWLIIGRYGTHSPREQLGMPSRWTCGA